MQTLSVCPAFPYMGGAEVKNIFKNITALDRMLRYAQMLLAIVG